MHIVLQLAFFHLSKWLKVFPNQPRLKGLSYFNGSVTVRWWLPRSPSDSAVLRDVQATPGFCHLSNLRSGSLFLLSSLKATLASSFVFSEVSLM